MNYITKYLLAFALIFTIVSCEKDEPDVVEVDERLQVFFDRFVEEGAARGRTIDFTANPVAGRIEDIEDQNVQGQCQSNSASANLVVFDTRFWEISSDLIREFVIFHELGHCSLDRDHTDEETDNGACISIMHSGTSGCTNTYNANTRSALLDELFMN